MKRPTADTVVLVLASVVGFSVVSLIVGTFVLAFVDPSSDTSALVRYLTDLVSTIVGALIGFIGGRASRT